jgi:hypothetical protein
LSNSPFYYVTAGTTKEFLRQFTFIAVKSLLKAGIDPDDIHVIGNVRQDRKLIKKHLPTVHRYQVDEDLSGVTWKIFKKKRKYSLFKAAGLHKIFTKPIEGRHMIYFDGDVLFYKNPYPFFETKKNKTWFHHGKNLASPHRATIKKKDVDMSSVKSLSKWISLPCADLMVRHKAKVLPDREVVAGLYLMHPRDHEKLLNTTYQFCKENQNKFRMHEGAGDQKPMNAALNVLAVDWHGGSRFDCPEHEQYFDHFFGKQHRKESFWAAARKLGIS